jgi:2-polyprenyl-6-methoxyphenol hydroxylase-like FAD-dependent oxidoreductase
LPSQPELPKSCQVLVVGAGPTGLSLAMELGRRGIRTVVVEQNDRVGYQPRAKLTNVRSMEHLRRWGIADRLRAASPFPADYPMTVVFATRMWGYPLARFENAFNGARERNELYSEPAQYIPQYLVEAVLRDAAQALPNVTLAFSTRFDDATETSDGVRAELTDLESGHSQRVEAAFLVGADGPRSRVRQLVGARMEGDHAYSQNFNVILRVPGLFDHPQEPGTMYWLLNADCPAILHPLDLEDRWVFSLQGTADGELDDRDVAQHLAAAVGRPLPCTILARDPWSTHRLIADRYRKGRLILVGDSCHLHAPAGGFGMNMGIGDAVDLGWKLAAILGGWGGKHLIESYETERRPVHRRTVGEAVENYALLATDLARQNLEKDGPEGEAARRMVGVEILRHKVREFRTLGVVLGNHYSGSPLVVPDGTEPPAEHFMDYLPSAHPGCLAPHCWLADGRSLYDLFGPGFTLLVTHHDDDRHAEHMIRAAAAARLPFDVAVPNDRRLLDLYGARFALIRPDQHVAWRGDRVPEDGYGLFEQLTGWCRRNAQ